MVALPEVVAVVVWVLKRVNHNDYILTVTIVSMEVSTVKTNRVCI
jgi:hypothetical protein